MNTKYLYRRAAIAQNDIAIISITFTIRTQGSNLGAFPKIRYYSWSTFKPWSVPKDPDWNYLVGAARTRAPAATNYDVHAPRRKMLVSPAS